MFTSLLLTAVAALGAPSSDHEIAIVGITTQPVDALLGAHLGLGSGEGLVIASVMDGYPARDAGLQVHDVIVAVDGHEPVDEDSFRKLVQSKTPGETVALDVLRAGRRLQFAVPTRAWAVAEPDVSAFREPSALSSGYNARFGDVYARDAETRYKEELARVYDEQRSRYRDALEAIEFAEQQAEFGVQAREKLMRAKEEMARAQQLADRKLAERKAAIEALAKLGQVQGAGDVDVFGLARQELDNALVLESRAADPRANDVLGLTQGSTQNADVVGKLERIEGRLDEIEKRLLSQIQRLEELVEHLAKNSGAR